MDHNTIKDFEDLGKKYFSVPGHRRLRSIKRVLTQEGIHGRENSIVNLLDKHASIVDAGCGGNPFKTIFPNLIAFDMVDYGNQDFVCSILEAPIQENSQDVVLCFGVLHECPDEYHKPNIVKMLSWLKPDGQLIMKCKKTKVIKKHPGGGKKRKILQEYGIYFDQGLWPQERINQFTNDLNLKINFIRPILITRKQQLNGDNNPIFNSKYADDIMFDGYVWSWSKND